MGPVIAGKFSRLISNVCLIFAASVLVACGGGGGGGDGASPTHVPSISNLRYSPTTALQSPGNSLSVMGTADFSDANGDISTLRFVVPTAGVDLTVPTPALSGVKSGTAAISFTIPLDTIGAYPFEIWVVDSQGSASNRLGGTFEILLDDTATKWRDFSVPAAQGRILFGVTTSGQQYVAVGQTGTIVTSGDLTTWTLRTSGVSQSLYSVAWSGQRYVAVGYDTNGEAVVLASSDAVTWANQYRAGDCQNGICARPAALRRVIWAGSQFVAVGTERVSSATSSGDYAFILTSSDGLSWTQRAKEELPVGFNGVGDLGLNGVAWSGSMLVAVGSTPSGQMPAAWTSPDGITWTFRPVSARNQVLRSVTWGRGNFVAVGWGYVTYRSPDGVNWQESTGMVSASNSVVAGPSRYVAVRGPLSPMTSTDGLVWTEVPAFPSCGNEIVWDQTRYVAVGNMVCASP